MFIHVVGVGGTHGGERTASEVSSRGSNPACQAALAALFWDLIYSGIKEQHPSVILRETEFEIGN